MNDDALLSRLAYVTDEQASAMVSRRALGELADDIARTATHQPPAAPARRGQARQVSPTRRRLTWAAASALAAESYHRDPPPGLEGVAAALRRLGDADREILTLAGWEGLDAGQIAVVLGCSRNAARIRLHRARRRFAVSLHDTRTAFAPELIRGNS